MVRFRFRPLVSPKYHRAMLKMGKHGEQWDCSREECLVCWEYRDQERMTWEDMDEEQRKSVVFGRFR